MNTQEVFKRLSKERRQWATAGHGPEMSWTLRGLDIARRIIFQVLQEERARNLERAPRLHRWLARDLFIAINRALRRLTIGERANAVKILEEARDAAMGNKINRTSHASKNGSSVTAP